MASTKQETEKAPDYQCHLPDNNCQPNLQSNLSNIWIACLPFKVNIFNPFAWILLWMRKTVDKIDKIFQNMQPRLVLTNDCQEPTQQIWVMTEHIYVFVKCASASEELKSSRDCDLLLWSCVWLLCDDQTEPTLLLSICCIWPKLPEE